MTYQFNNFRQVYFNAPAMTQADIVYYPGRYEAPELNEPSRLPAKSLLLDENRGTVIARKGWLTPDLTYENDWEEQDVDPESEDDEQPKGPWSGRNTDTDETNEAPTPDEEKANIQNLFPSDTQYGFRFMYNPPQIDFNIGLANGVNFSYILSGAEKAAPMIASGSSIGVSLTISRVDDLAIIRSLNQRREPTREQLRSVIGLYGAWGSGKRTIAGAINPNDINQRSMFINSPESDAKLAQLEEIATEGTMHDMNYLFRSFAAKNWKTAYRGTTADIGIAYSVPLILYLSQKMIYRVRLASLNYTHRVFNQDMIPTLTDVTMTFARIPDVVGWEGSNGPGEQLGRRE